MRVGLMLDDRSIQPDNLSGLGARGHEADCCGQPLTLGRHELCHA